MRIKISTVNLLLLLGLLLFMTACQNKSQEADLIITNAIIWTGNDDQPRAEAMAISADTIQMVGSIDEVSALIGKKTIVNDLSGKFITPGFIDSHVHFLTGGFNLASVQLRDAKTPEEFIQRIADYAQTLPKGTWILGGDWDHENWGGELPDKEWIDKVTKDNPVFINRLDGHMALANSLALNMSGLDRDTKDVDGGEIIRNSDRELSGIFKDNAMDLVYKSIPEPSKMEFENALVAAMNYVASNGVTSVHHMSASANLKAIQKAHSEGKLITRIYAMLPLWNWEELNEMIETDGQGDKWIKIGGLKGFVDGSLGSHTAAFFEPYTDMPSDSGFFVVSMDSIYKKVKDADNANLQVMIHAIGDKAINNLLDVYEKVKKENGTKDRRFRIEHAQHIDTNDINRFWELDVIASMQPYHAIDDGRWAEKLIGSERIKTTYAFKSLFESDAIVAFGSDWFVAPPTPLEGIYAAVTRRTLDDKNPNGWVPEQKISIEQALKAYTINGAYAAFDENIKGTLEVGKLADFVVINEDLTKVDPNRIWDLKVLQTYVGGKKVFDLNDK